MLVHGPVRVIIEQECTLPALVAGLEEPLGAHLTAQKLAR
jgi:hypothetical protein